MSRDCPRGHADLRPVAIAASAGGSLQARPPEREAQAPKRARSASPQASAKRKPETTHRPTAMIAAEVERGRWRDARSLLQQASTRAAEIAKTSAASARLVEAPGIEGGPAAKISRNRVVDKPAEVPNGGRNSAKTGAVSDSSGSFADPIEGALAAALRGATAAGEWSVVAQLARALEARRQARVGVVDLEAARRARGTR